MSLGEGARGAYCCLPLKGSAGMQGLCPGLRGWAWGVGVEGTVRTTWHVYMEMISNLCQDGESSAYDEKDGRGTHEGLMVPVSSALLVPKGSIPTAIRRGS